MIDENLFSVAKLEKSGSIKDILISFVFALISIIIGIFLTMSMIGAIFGIFFIIGGIYFPVISISKFYLSKKFTGNCPYCTEKLTVFVKNNGDLLFSKGKKGDFCKFCKREFFFKDGKFFASK